MPQELAGTVPGPWETVAQAETALRKAARQRGIVLVEHTTALARARAGLARLDRALTVAKNQGLLWEFNARFEWLRQKQPRLNYGHVHAKLKGEIARRIARSAGQLPDLSNIVDAVLPIPIQHSAASQLHGNGAFVTLPRLSQPTASYLRAGGTFAIDAIVLSLPVGQICHPDPEVIMPEIKRPRGRPDRTITIDKDTWAALRPEATSRGCSIAGLALDLLAVIARDHLIGAVLDTDEGGVDAQAAPNR